MNKKIHSGAVGLISQPIYDVKNATKLLEHFNNAKSQFTDERAKSQLILGIFVGIFLELFCREIFPGKNRP